MLITDQQIKASQRFLADKTAEILSESSHHFVAADPTRLKILLLLRRHGELCVSDLAEILQLSLSAVSHQLSLLERQQLVTGNKVGKTVCYTLRQTNPRKSILNS